MSPGTPARGGAVVAALMALTLLSACGEDEMDAAMAQPGASPAAMVCAKDAKPVDLPDGFPQQATLPAGYVVTGVQARSGGRTVVTAVAPTPFEQTLADMQRAYSTRGWTASDGEVEERDAESDFDGNGFRGRWAIRQIPDCTGNTAVSLLIGT